MSNQQSTADFLAKKFDQIPDDTIIDTVLYKSGADGKVGYRQFKAGELKNFLAENEDNNGLTLLIHLHLGKPNHDWFHFGVKHEKIDESDWKAGTVEGRS